MESSSAVAVTAAIDDTHPPHVTHTYGGAVETREFIVYTLAGGATV